VVDDEPIVRNVVVRYLERDGYRTLEAGDGNAGRRLLERDHPSLVVLDVMLPGRRPRLARRSTATATRMRRTSPRGLAI
jgi:DNA-binding response OmpR family regulator